MSIAMLFSFGQSDITAMEYYIDTDPGTGLATSVAVSTGQEVDINFTVPVSGMGLSVGFHLIGVRTQNAAGDWSMHEKRVFYIQESAGTPPPVSEDITALEYFLDEDPGVGMATSVAISSGQEIDINELVSSVSLNNGFHLIGVRARNADNQWGFTESRIFFIQDISSINPVSADITALEYFFDEDPGVGMANGISIANGPSLDINELIATGSLSDGFHTISVRAKNADERWGMTETRVIYIQNISSGPPIVSAISALEYYIDTDPGTGNGIQIPITPSLETVDIMSMAISTGGSLTIGDHTLTIRAQNENGLWGQKETVTFQVDGDCPIAGFDIQSACVGEPLQLLDTSTGILGTAVYNWYADGVLISNTEGDVSHSFDSPGMHTLSLAIQNGAICTDSTGVSVEIKAKPFVVFQADVVDEGTPTTFLTDEFNLDPASTWEWDFDTDGNIDDTTPGSTSFTFPTGGTYTTTLYVTDGQGCGTSFSRSVTVNTLGALVPDFSAEEVCLGEVTMFTDLSSNVPGDATWSWDFDGDGNEDDATAGNTSFTYTTEGTYTVTLTIETADASVFTHVVDVTVSSVPVASFTVETNCPDDPVLFTDNSQNTAQSMWFWDFDSNGTIDSQTAGDVSYTYPGAGTYAASLLIENAAGCFDFTAVNVVLDDNPTTSAFDFTYRTSASSALAEFINLSENGTDYSWDFGDGNTSLESSPSHEFEEYAGQTFQICLTSSNECTTDQVCQSITFTITGLQDLNDAGILAYPNPGDGHLNLDFSNVEKDVYQISIYNLTGKLVYQTEHNTLFSTHFEKRSIRPGNYLLKVKSEKLNAQQKLVVR